MPHGPHSRTWEARWRHAHNSEDVPVQTNLVTDDVGPAGEARPPQLAADDDDRMSAWRQVVGGREESPAIGGEAEDVEEVAGDEIAEGAIRAVAGVQADDGENGGVGANAEGERQDGRERVGWLLPQGAGCIAEVLPEIAKQASGGNPRRDGFGCVRLSQRREVSCEYISIAESGERQLR